MLRLILNVLWLVLSGFWMALAYVVAGVLMCITIIGIPFGIQAFKLAGYALWPFGRALAPTGRRPGLSVIGNVIWFILAGWWLAIGHLLAGVALCLTIIGIPLGSRQLQDGRCCARPVRTGDRLAASGHVCARGHDRRAVRAGG